jgi:sugar lactone lactonase YvrE
VSSRRRDGCSGSYPARGRSRIAFLATSGSAVETVLPDGSQPIAVATAPRFAGGLAWSQDGRVAWLEQSVGGSLSPAVARSGHVSRFPLAPLRGPARGTGLAWSPDGTRLAFTAVDRSLVGDVWTVAADGTGLARVTHGLGAIGPLSWVTG